MQFSTRVALIAPIVASILLALAAIPLCQDAPPAEQRARVQENREQTKLLSRHHYDSPADRANDALLTTEVTAALEENGLTGDHPIIVDADHGIVTLTGFAESREDIRRAGELAAHADGVRGVRNKLLVAR